MSIAPHQTPPMIDPVKAELNIPTDPNATATASIRVASPLPSVPPQAGEPVRYSLAQLLDTPDINLNYLVAEQVMGWKPKAPMTAMPLRNYVCFEEYKGKVWKGTPYSMPKNNWDWRMDVFAPSTDIAAAFALQERIAELGLQKVYCFHLIWIWNSVPGRKDFDWLFANATPRERTLAAILCVQESRR